LTYINNCAKITYEMQQSDAQAVDNEQMPEVMREEEEQVRVYTAEDLIQHIETWHPQVTIMPPVVARGVVRIFVRWLLRQEGREKSRIE